MLHTTTTVRTSRTQRLIAACRFRTIFGKRVRSLTHRKRRRQNQRDSTCQPRHTPFHSHFQQDRSNQPDTRHCNQHCRKSFFTSILASRAQMLHTATTVRTSRAQRLIAACRFRTIFGKRVRSLTHRKRRRQNQRDSTCPQNHTLFHSHFQQDRSNQPDTRHCNQHSIVLLHFHTCQPRTDASHHHYSTNQQDTTPYRCVSLQDHLREASTIPHPQEEAPQNQRDSTCPPRHTPFHSHFQQDRSNQPDTRHCNQHSIVLLHFHTCQPRTDASHRHYSTNQQDTTPYHCVSLQDHLQEASTIPHPQEEALKNQRDSTCQPRHTPFHSHFQQDRSNQPDTRHCNQHSIVLLHFHTCQPRTDASHHHYSTNQQDTTPYRCVSLQDHLREASTIPHPQEEAPQNQRDSTCQPRHTPFHSHFQQDRSNQPDTRHCNQHSIVLLHFHTCQPRTDASHRHYSTNQQDTTPYRCVSLQDHLREASTIPHPQEEAPQNQRDSTCPQNHTLFHSHFQQDRSNQPDTRHCNQLKKVLLHFHTCQPRTDASHRHYSTNQQDTTPYRCVSLQDHLREASTIPHPQEEAPQNQRDSTCPQNHTLFHSHFQQDRSNQPDTRHCNQHSIVLLHFHTCQPRTDASHHHYSTNQQDTTPYRCVSLQDHLREASTIPHPQEEAPQNQRDSTCQPRHTPFHSHFQQDRSNQPDTRHCNQHSIVLLHFHTCQPRTDASHRHYSTNQQDTTPYHCVSLQDHLQEASTIPHPQEEAPQNQRDSTCPQNHTPFHSHFQQDRSNQPDTRHCNQHSIVLLHFHTCQPRTDASHHHYSTNQQDRWF